MAYTQFKTVSGSPKTENDASLKDIRSRQIDELVRISQDARKEVYGPEWDRDCKNFYNLFESTKRMPSYRPSIKAPQLQILLLQEAAESTDTNIRVFIHKKTERDKEREKAFQEYWKKNFFGLQILMAQIYAQFSGTSWLSVGNDPMANRGKGLVWLRARKQETVYCDPSSPWPEDWSWQCVEDYIYIDTLRKDTPHHIESVKKATGKSMKLAGGPAGDLEMPPGPMSISARGLPSGEEYSTEGLLRRRTLYCLDSTLREVTEAEKQMFEKNKLPIPEMLPKYPTGRMVVDVEGTIMVDGDSWCPLPDKWPNVPVWALPPWDTVWCPAPMKYTKSLQDAAEQQMTNTYENARRLNNGMMVIHETTGLTANTVGGFPGEVVVVSAISQPGAGIDIKYPPPFPPQMITLPQSYLALQKELRGATPERQGRAGTGNVGPDLFDAAVSQSQAGTRLTARLYSWSIQKIVDLLFYTMSKSFGDPMVFLDRDKIIKWNPDSAAEEFEIQVPDGAVRPMSQTALRSMIIELKKAGMIDTRHGLEMLDVPDADEIADAVEREMALAALAKGVKK